MRICLKLATICLLPLTFDVSAFAYNFEKVRERNPHLALQADEKEDVNHAKRVLAEAMKHVRSTDFLRDFEYLLNLVGFKAKKNSKPYYNPQTNLLRDLAIAFYGRFDYQGNAKSYVKNVFEHMLKKAVDQERKNHISYMYNIIETSIMAFSALPNDNFQTLNGLNADDIQRKLTHNFQLGLKKPLALMASPPTYANIKESILQDSALVAKNVFDGAKPRYGKERFEQTFNQPNVISSWHDFLAWNNDLKGSMNGFYAIPDVFLPEGARTQFGYYQTFDGGQFGDNSNGFEPLSNFYARDFTFTFKSIQYHFKNAEALFHALKLYYATGHDVYLQQFQNMSADESKNTANQVFFKCTQAQQKQWFTNQDQAMRDILEAKFVDHGLADYLRAFLIEGNGWGELNWGMHHIQVPGHGYVWVGHGKLGKLLRAVFLTKDLLKDLPAYDRGEGAPLAAEGHVNPDYAWQSHGKLQWWNDLGLNVKALFSLSKDVPIDFTKSKNLALFIDDKKIADSVAKKLKDIGVQCSDAIENADQTFFFSLRPEKYRITIFDKEPFLTFLKMPQANIQAAIKNWPS